jgi:hypothetical protein
MKIEGRPADFFGTKEKREEKDNDFNVEKGDGLFLPLDLFFLFSSFFSHDFHRKTFMQGAYIVDVQSIQLDA